MVQSSEITPAPTVDEEEDDNRTIQEGSEPKPVMDTALDTETILPVPQLATKSEQKQTNPLSPASLQESQQQRQEEQLSPWYSRFRYRKRGQGSKSTDDRGKENRSENRSGNRSDTNQVTPRRTTLMSGPPFLLKYRSSNWFAILTVTLAVFTDVFLYGVLVPVLPFALVNRGHIEQSSVQSWVSTLLAIYGAGTLVFAPICGWLSDRISSRRWPLIAGLIALIGTTVMLHIGGNIAVFVIARLLQGISAAVVWVVGLALLADTVEENQLGQFMGYVTLGMSLGFLIAPVLGGVVYQRAGYNAVFAMCYALIVLDLLFRILLIEKKNLTRWCNDEENTPAAERAMQSAEESNEDHTKVVINSSARTENAGGDDCKMEVEQSINPEQGGAAAAATTTTTAPQHQQNPEPPPPPNSSNAQLKPKSTMNRLINNLPPVITLLSSRRLLAGLFACLVQSILMAAFDSVLPIYVNQIFGWYSLQAGVLELTVVIPTFLAPLVGYFCDRYGGRWFATVGFLSACPLYVLLRLIDHDTMQQKVALCALLTLIGLTLTLAFPPLTAEVSYVVVAKEKARPGIYGPGGAYGQAYSLFNVAFAAGTMIGPIWGGFIKDAAGWGTMTWSLGLLSGVTAVPTVCLVGGAIWKRKGEEEEDKEEEQEEVVVGGGGGGGENNTDPQRAERGERSLPASVPPT